MTKDEMDSAPHTDRRFGPRSMKISPGFEIPRDAWTKVDIKGRFNTADLSDDEFLAKFGRPRLEVEHGYRAPSPFDKSDCGMLPPIPTRMFEQALSHEQPEAQAALLAQPVIAAVRPDLYEPGPVAIQAEQDRLAREAQQAAAVQTELDELAVAAAVNELRHTMQDQDALRELENQERLANLETMINGG